MYGLGLGQLGRVGGKTWNERTALWPLGTEPGLWIDPGYTSVSYQNSTGTTPISAIGTLADSSNPIGLQLDRKWGPVLGPELVTNPGSPFTVTTGWHAVSGASLAVSSGSLQATTSGAGGAAYTIVTTVGKWYTVSATISNAAGIAISFGVLNIAESLVLAETSIEARTTPTSVSVTFLATETAANVYSRLSATGVAVIDGASVKEIPGLHLSQATSTAQPVLSARVNNLLLTNLESGVTLNGITVTRTILSPDNTSYWMTCTETAVPAVPSGHEFYQSTTPAATIANVVYNSSCYVKAGTRRYVYLSCGASATGVAYRVFDTVSGIWSDIGRNTISALYISSEIENISSGVWRLSIAWSSSVANKQYVAVSGSNSDTLPGVVPASYLGNVGMNWSAWGIQSETASIATPYQRVNTDADYTASSIIYDKFDGTDDALLSATVAAGVVGNSNMDCLIAVRRDSAASAMCGLTSSTGTWYFGAASSGNAGVCCVGVGFSLSIYVDNVVLAGGSGVTSDALHTALTVGPWHILEIRGLDLSSITTATFSGLGGWTLNGATGGIMLFPSASAADRDKARTRLAAKVGLVL